MSTPIKLMLVLVRLQWNIDRGDWMGKLNRLKEYLWEVSLNINDPQFYQPMTHSMLHYTISMMVHTIIYSAIIVSYSYGVVPISTLKLSGKRM